MKGAIFLFVLSPTRTFWPAGRIKISPDTETGRARNAQLIARDSSLLVTAAHKLFFKLKVSFQKNQT